jgi:pentose-5-phosphate-3-epimerase
MDHDLDQVLVMTCEVEVDGGIDATTAPLVVRAGATVLVAGSATFGDGDGVAAAMNRLRTALDDTRCETECAERSALQRSQACSSE